MSYFTVFRAQIGCANCVTSHYSAQMCQSSYITVLRSKGLCQLSSFTVFRAQIGSVIYDVLLLM